jgi:hypothetical protein
VTDVETVLGDDELTRRIDPGQRTRHLVKCVNDDGACLDPRLEQAPLQDVEPPRGIGRRVIGRSFAEMTAFGRQDRGRHLFQQLVSYVFRHHGFHTVEKR